jgi:UDP-3-O-[3-hydroxymyristoyl] glucosamine N-acyltransferase
MKLTVKELAERLGCPYEGDATAVITGVASLEKAGKGDLVFLGQPKFRSLLEKTGASAVILPPDEIFDRIPVLRAQNPHLAFVRATEIFFEPLGPGPGIHPWAAVSPSAKIGKGVSLGAFCTVGDEVEVGDGTAIFPLVTVYPRVKIGVNTVIHSNTSIREGVRIGSRVIIHNGVVIGSDGFGYLRGEDGTHMKIPQIGTVSIEDDVEIGANTTIDRATLGETVVRKGAKIDNLVMVAHNVEIGEKAILAGQAGIAGSSKVGSQTILSGQVGIADHVEVGDNVIIAAKSGVTKSISAGSFVSGSPHLDIRDWRKFWALAPQLYDIVKDFKRLKVRIEEIEKILDRLKKSSNEE